MNSPSSTSQRACEAALRAAEVLCVFKHSNSCVDRLLCYLAPQFLSPDVVSHGHFSPNLCVEHSYSGFISTHFGFPLLAYLEAFSWKPAPQPSQGIQSAAWRDTSAFRVWPCVWG